MSSAVKPITLNILDKEYVVGCTDEEREALMSSVDYLNLKLREQRDSGKVIGNERVAVMAALNIAHELLDHRREHESKTLGLGDKLNRIHRKIEAALARSATPGHA